MQAAIERRASRGPRIPLDDVLIELSHEGFDEAFEADGVDVGLGGLAMRAPILPDVGSRLHCSFQTPGDGDRVSADCEVVWAKDSGPHIGQFGLRFMGLGGEAEESLERLLSSWSDLLGDPLLAAQPTTTTLELEGVRSPLVGEVAHRSSDVLLVEQALPFLSVGIGVAEVGASRVGRLTAVDLRMEEATPRLVLTIVYEDGQVASDGPADAVDTAPMDTMPDTETPEEGWVARGEQDGAPAPASQAVGRVVEARRESLPVADAHDVDDREAPAQGRSETAQVFTLEARDDDEVASTDEDRRLIDEMTGPKDARALALHVKGRLVTFGRAARAWIAVVAARLVPAARNGLARTKKFGAAARQRGGPAVAATLGRLRGLALAFAGVLRSRVGKVRQNRAGRAKKRSTARPPEAGTNVRSSQRGEAEPPPRSKGRRTALLSAAVALSVAATAYALTPADEGLGFEVDKPPKRSRFVAAPAPAPAAQAAPAPAAAPSPAAQVAPAEPVESAALRAMGEPSYQAGQMPAPTFPTLGDARPQAPGAVPADSPYAVDQSAAGEASGASASGRAFGAQNVPRARSYTLRMSRPVQSLRGEALADGFKVIVDGALSLDRAGPIAAAHPHVDRSMVLNRGDHSELTIRFVGGRTPAYRVVARGSAIEVQIAR